MGIYKDAKSRILLQIKKDVGDRCFTIGLYNAALRNYNEALQIDKNNKIGNAKVYFKIATLYATLKHYKIAEDACTAALELNKNYVKALLCRAKCYTAIGEFEEAVKDYERLYKIDKSKANKQLLNEAKIALIKSKDYYKLLGVKNNASGDDIRKAFRNCALMHHPDRHVNSSDKERRKHEHKFKEISEAYGVLSDPGKRSCYDHKHPAC